MIALVKKTVQHRDTHNTRFGLTKSLALSTCSTEMFFGWEMDATANILLKPKSNDPTSYSLDINFFGVLIQH